ncbi:50S ribosomal protein L11 methyltransferase [Emcibacter sp. SYSU 3D8]|uniref:50S ribosomal protein L11 methyltransferase n=1 Tax=Emcibacter sp. SYSU 3D8 TaxID=3133969 RepID=UPI0031FF1B7A
MTDIVSWQVHVEVPRSAVPVVEGYFGTLGADEASAVIMSFEIKGDQLWGVDVVVDEPVSGAFLSRGLNKALAEQGADAVKLTVTELAPVDWVAESLKHHQPVSAGRFYVYGSHHPEPALDRYAILIDAGMAFGTGQHETTAGCLRAIDALARTGTVRNPLDVGSGSGILAMAMAKAWPCRVLASDIDPEAVKVAIDNARDNGVGGRIDVLTAVGLHHPAIRERAPFDLITANILAKPLVQLAADLTAALAPGGTLVLSGFLRQQEAGVFAAYRHRGMRLLRRFPVGEWVTLVLGKA